MTIGAIVYILMFTDEVSLCQRHDPSPSVEESVVGRKYTLREPMETNAQAAETLSAIIRARRSIRSFTKAVPPDEGMKEILQSAIFAPFGRATDLASKDIRKIFVFSRDTENMNIARELLLGQIRRVARKVQIALLLVPFLRKKMGLFSKRITALAENGIPGLADGAFYIVVAVKKGFPAMEKQTIAHAMQNMWLSATAQGLGFQLVSQTAMMSKNKEFMGLLRLKPGDYELDGCVIGMPKMAPESREERHLEDFVTWVQ
jgi:nitroreductase